MYLLAGDIGGTKALLQLVKKKANNETTLVDEKRFLCAEFDTLESILNNFLTDCHLNGQIEVACLGLPGPVNSRTVQLTNLPWVVDADKIEQACSIKRVDLINDFYAAANGVDVLRSEDIVVLHQPEALSNCQQAVGNRLVVGAGTGLGVAPVFFDGNNYAPLASEGGHFDFAPISSTQQFLLQWLWQKWEHVSYERVLSGPGLEVLYAFFDLTDCPNSFCLEGSQNEDSQKLKKTTLSFSQNINLGAIIAETVAKEDDLIATRKYTAEQVYLAAERGEPAAVKALTEFVTIYGSYIGAAALIWNAPGGIYLAGGIASKILHWMNKPYFLNAFLEKGRMSALVQTMPIYLVTDDKLGLKGAMHFNEQNLNLIAST